MRRVTSGSTSRIRPGHPANIEEDNQWDALLGAFNEGMDRLNTERQLENDQQMFFSNHPTSSHTRRYQQLLQTTATFWQLALDKQDFIHGRSQVMGPYSLGTLGTKLSQLANEWSELKRIVDIAIQTERGW